VFGGIIFCLEFMLVIKEMRQINNKRSILFIIFFFLFGNEMINAQGEVCIPQTWVGKKVKGTIYINTGDSVSGKFTHLTPRNDYFTTHIIIDENNGVKEKINRAEIVSYFDKKKKEKRYKVYPNVDSVFVKKNCHFDMGVFMLILVDGPNKLLMDVLESNASIQAYNQSESNAIYYLLPPNKKLIEINRTDLKPQLQSLFSDYPGTEQIFSEPGFNIERASEIVRLANTSISEE